MVYDVHSIEAKRRKGGKTEYFIQWKDHLPSENTWEPMSNLQGSEELVNEFEKAWQAKYDAAEAEASQDRERRRHTHATLHLKHLKVLVLVKPKTLLFIKLKTSIESMSMQQ